MGAFHEISNIFPLFSNIATSLSLVEQTVQTLYGNRTAGEDLALRQLQDRQALQQQQSEQSAQLERERIATEARQAEETRRAALRRAVSRQKANFGADGVGSSGGSSEAVLLGMFQESDAERARREQLDNLRNRSLDLQLSQQSALNLLQSTQLARRNHINNVFYY